MGDRTRVEQVAKALHGAFCRAAPRRDLLALAARKIHSWGPPIVGTYVYELHTESLRLAAFEGPAIESTTAQVGAPASCRDVETALIAAEDRFAFAVAVHLHDLIHGAVAIAIQPNRGPGDDLTRDVTQVAEALATLL